MLRESALVFGYPVDVTAIGDRTVDPRVPGGVEVLNFVDAMYANAGIDQARTIVIDALSTEAFVDAAAVYANFSMMNRVAEGTGIPIPGAAFDREADVIAALNLTRMLKH